MIAAAESEKVVARSGELQLRRPLPSLTDAEREKEQDRAAGAAARVEIELRRAEAEAEIAWRRYFEAVDRDSGATRGGVADAEAVEAAARSAAGGVEAARRRNWRAEGTEEAMRVHGRRKEEHTGA